MNARRIFSIGLAAVLQVLPLTRVFVAATPAVGSSYAIIATWIAGTAALLGGIDAVSGASTAITSPSTAKGTNGVAFSYRITTGPETANTFAAAPLPTGLAVNTSSGRITGTPTVTGVYGILLTASDNGNASRTVTMNLTLTILASAGGGTPPSITSQPTSQTVVQGGNASFTVAASGTAPLGYQWRLGAGNVAGATGATLSLNSVTSGQAGNYTCVVSNSSGSVTSSMATLTVLVPPTITTQPGSQTVTAGGSANFTVAASGTAPLSYQWRLDGANVSGATSSTLNLTGLALNQAGNYTCVITNSAGSITSSVATLTVNPPPIAPAITTQPRSQTITEGGSVSFTVGASGTAPLSYQWRWNGVSITGATSATLALSGVAIDQAGSYTCYVTNAVGNATSLTAILTVNPLVVAPTITTQPGNQSVLAGADASFSVTASGTAPLSYQWRSNGTNLVGATGAALTVNAVTLAQSGFPYVCVIANAAGSITSSVAILTVTAAAVAPAIIAGPVSQTVTAGAAVTFTVGVSGTAPLSYQWLYSGGPLSGATSATLALTGVTTNQSGSYSVTVTNSAGAATSAPATLTVNPAPVAPTITLQPISQTVLAGTNVTFTVTATGTAPLTYQWRLNGVNLSGATSAALSLVSVTTNQTGAYSCLVSNVAGTAISSGAALTVNPVPVAPIIITPPNSQTVAAGANVTFTVAASGTQPMSQQWRLNGGNIPGATSPTLTLTSVATNQAGSYSCLVSNVAGFAISSAATLTVNPALLAPTIVQQPASQTVVAGASVSFTVAASGSAPLSYQWRWNGAKIAGATSPTLSLTGVSTNQAGNYSCMVSNPAGTTPSAAAALTVNATQPSILTVSITGQGRVLPELNGASLVVGKVYTVGAYPSAGYIFSGWTRANQPLSTSSMISFVMTSNLVLAANFAVDPLVAAAGSYNGLFYETDAVRLNSAGAFNVGLSASGSYSAWVQIGYTRYQFSGQLDENFQATSIVTRWNGTPLMVQFTIGQDALAGQIYGSVSDGVWTAPLSGGRSPAPAAVAGDYTVVLPGTAGNANLPAGDGYATLHVTADGMGTMNGTLADGATFSHSAYVTPDGDWPLYISLYVGKGAIISWLKFTNLSTSDVSGDLVWIKQAGASATSFPLGFTNGTKAVGSAYVAPVASGKAVNLASGVVSFSGGSLVAAFNNSVSVNAGSQVVNLSPNQMTFALAPASGVFTGQVNEPGNGVAHQFGGVILQKQNAGYGTMVGMPNGSRTVLTAP